jgi:hypothetical protein
VQAREWLAATLRDADIDALPSEANLLLVHHGVEDAALVDGLLRRGILVRPGSELGLPGWASITVGPAPLMGPCGRGPVRGASGPQSRTSPRAMTRRWMSDVPSSISSSLASRIHFSTGCSRE